jgi:hypothetical protein
MNTQCLMQVGETLWPEHIHMALSVFTWYSTVKLHSLL